MIESVVRGGIINIQASRLRTHLAVSVVAALLHKSRLEITLCKVNRAATTGLGRSNGKILV